MLSSIEKDLTKLVLFKRILVGKQKPTLRTILAVYHHEFLFPFIPKQHLALKLHIAIPFQIKLNVNTFSHRLFSI